MESSTLYAPNVTKIVKKNGLSEAIERTDRNIINSILQQFPSKENVFSVNNLNSRVVCLFRDLQTVSYSTLQKIYVLSEKVKKINIMMKRRCVEVQIVKDNQKIPVKIKKRPNIQEIEQCANKFLDKQNIHKSDRRVCAEIVKLLYKMTWGGVACKLTMNLFGDTYQFQVGSLRRISYQQMTSLKKISDLISDIHVNFNSKLLTFKVVRCNEYITLNEIKNNISVKKQKV